MLLEDSDVAAGMRVKLTYRQVEQMRRYFDRVQAAAVAGDPGMLVAQIRLDRRNNEYIMEPAFLEHEHAKVITEKGRSIDE